ncbi:Os02g0307050 [Oryza sativa Japonica Group]|jgi:hypothetical protein|uniref:Os02g0307050 protein n=1 Tax=Oryza sativa subsp. japonica TaxID=39947 RepID=A0A0P0VI18_ORYSJ|nr:hypothetical protein EE612_010694 [Oryza sativa]BAS78294.1 Os02g0307050 [Oryza sativa Japonica Group]
MYSGKKKKQGPKLIPAGGKFIEKKKHGKQKFYFCNAISARDIQPTKCCLFFLFLNEMFTPPTKTPTFPTSVPYSASN